MAKVVKSKYNSTGERCVDACLNYGNLRYINEDGSPINIEIPFDKYDEALSDIEDRIREGMIQEEINPKEVLKRGSFTYDQVRNMANEGKIKGLEFFEIDGSIECEHMLGISGSLEYALSLWNGESTEEALLKSIIRAIKVFGEEFIRTLSLDNTIDIAGYIRFAKNLSTRDSMIDIELYKVRSYELDDDIQINELDAKEQLIKNIDLPLGILGAFIGFILVQVSTNFGEFVENDMAFLILNVITMVFFGLIIMKSTKFITNKYVKTNSYSVVELFNEELEKSTYDNLLTEKECHIILKNITRGEISKLLIDMKGSVNKKISSNTIVTKESKFILDARKAVILPTQFEIKEGLAKLIGTYNDKLATEYNVNNV